MTRLSLSSFGFVSISSLGLVLAAVACSSSTPSNPGGMAGAATAGGGGPSGGGASGNTAGAPNSTAGNGTVAGAGNNTAGASSGTAGNGSGTAGSNPGGAGAAGAAGASGGVGAAGTPGTAGSGSGGAPATVTLPPLVTSAPGAYWKTDGTLTDSTAAATVTVNDTAVAQKWDGFGAAFNELGWTVLTTADMKTQAIKLLFSATDGAAFSWGRIPMGASDYATSRYDDDGGTDVAPSGETNRPAKDTSMAMFSITRDGQNLIPYIKAAQAVKPDLRFWSSPWTPPVWMKTGFATAANGAKKPSFYDGGNMTSDAATLTAYASYYTKFVQGYKAQGIDISVVSPQNEPGYEQNYPSCLWDKATYTTWVGKYLGPAMKAINVQVMLGTLSNAGDNSRTDLDIATAVLADSTAKAAVSMAGAQWGVLDKVVGGTTFGGLPIWATEHRCGNYPWNPSGQPAYNSTQAPNDQAYGVESWGYIRDAITKGKVVSYSAWNMVLDKSGLGIDTTRDWKQDALLVADGGKVNPTPAYYVFRHMSQYVTPGASVVGTTGGDAIGFKNPDGSIVAVLFNSGAANPSYVVAIGGKKVQFAMPANGWATVKVKP